VGTSCGRCMDAVRTLWERHVDAVWTLYGRCKDVVGTSYGRCTRVVRKVLRLGQYLALEKIKSNKRILCITLIPHLL